METRIPTLAFFFLSLCNAAFVQSAFPTIEELVIDSYTTEVQVTDVAQAAAAYAIESYYSNQGRVKLLFEGDATSIHYDNLTRQIIEVKEYNCTVSDVSDTEYDYTPLYYGWLNKEPLRIGPSAPLWYAQTRYKDIVESGKRFARNIECEMYTLPVKNKYDDLNIEYYFAPKGWTTPYKQEKLRVPVRIRIVGNSSRYSENHKIAVPVEQINDFAYFKPTDEDLDLLPPVGLGCRFKAKAEDFPVIPKTFQYSAEVVDVLATDPKTGHDDIEIKFQKSWYDHEGLLARLDTYSRKKGATSALYDFNTGTMYKIQNDGSCTMIGLRNTEFEVYDYGNTRRMMEPKEALNLDGEFYDMGKRQIRSLNCDAYESVEYGGVFRYIKYYKLVVTVYFSDTLTYMGVNGNTESRIPIYLMITGYSSPKDKALQLQYNIFEFDNVIAPEMYSSFRLDQCYTKTDSKTSFLLIMNAKKEISTLLEKNAEKVESDLRDIIAVVAKVPKMRIPYLRVDYKPTSVYIRGVMLERPPAELQFFKIDSGEMTTRDPDLKTVVEAKTIEQCSYACVDSSELCKGFYFCNQACFLKSTDISDLEEGEPTVLGDCLEYIRDEIDSTNFRQSYLSDALGFLETAVLNKSMIPRFKIENLKEELLISEILIGDGPYTGVDMVDKPYSVSIEDRKLRASSMSVKRVPYTGTLSECYKRCKEAGSECSSFSFCPQAKDDKKECMITQDLIVKDVVKDSSLIADRNCNIYNMQFLDLFTAFPEKLSLLAADKEITGVESTEHCARECRMETVFTCRGFEYCNSMKTCTLHKKHILDLSKAGETGKALSRDCTHYAARYIRDYVNLGITLIDDKSSMNYDATLEECAKICSEEQAANCKSFNFCPGQFGTGSCALSMKVLTDDKATTVDDDKCTHYEKKETVNDWDNSKASSLDTAGYTKKGFTGLVIGMIVLGLIVGALGFVSYSCYRSRSGDGSMAVRFMKSDS